MRRLSGEKGFSLLEVLIFLAIFAVVLGAVYLVYMTSHTTATWGENKIELQQNARVALEMAAREIRMVGYDPSNAIPGQPVCCRTAFQVAGANTVTFIGDVTGDDVTDKVRYLRGGASGNQVIREISSWVGGVWTPTVSSEVADGVTAVSFTYYDGSDAVTATLANIRRITIAITAQGTAGVRLETFPLTMDVRSRNLN